MSYIMKNKSRKQKGRRLQNYVRDRLLKTFKHLRKKDVEVAVMSQPGADIILSKVGKKLIPYDFECKNQEKMKTIYQWYNQAKRHGDLEPVLVMKQNSREELVVVSLDHFLKLIA